MGSLADKTIYAIRHNVTGRIYVGCSLHFEKRIRQHISHLRNNNHTNFEMQKDYNLYGEDYTYYIIETNVKFHDCFDREKMWMSILHSNEIEKGYNLMKTERPIRISDFQTVDVEIGKKKNFWLKEKNYGWNEECTGNEKATYWNY